MRLLRVHSSVWMWNCIAERDGGCVDRAASFWRYIKLVFVLSFVIIVKFEKLFGLRVDSHWDAMIKRKKLPEKLDLRICWKFTL